MRLDMYWIGTEARMTARSRLLSSRGSRMLARKKKNGTAKRTATMSASRYRRYEFTGAPFQRSQEDPDIPGFHPFGCSPGAPSSCENDHCCASQPPYPKGRSVTRSSPL